LRPHRLALWIFFPQRVFSFRRDIPERLQRQAGWKEDWEKTLRAAETEGQWTLYGCRYEYDRILEGFRKKYPKIKVTSVLGPGGSSIFKFVKEVKR
jgi:hypothetical protein